MRSEACPLCAQTEGATHPIHVCGNCHLELHATGALPVSATGEFSAITSPVVDPPSGEAIAQLAGIRCCWCDKRPEAVRKILSQGAYHICNECVALCADILQMELGD